MRHLLVPCLTAAIFLIGALRSDAEGVRIGVQFLNPQVASGNNPVNGNNAGAPEFTQSVWNGVFVEDNSNPTFTTWSQSGISLTDQSGAVSPITLSYFCQGSLPTDAVTPGQSSVTSHEKLVSNAIMTFCDAGFVKFTNVPSGAYNLVVYTVNRHGDGSNGTVSQFGRYSVNGGPPVTLGNQYGEDFTASGDTYKSHAGYPLTAGNVGDPNNAGNYFVFANVAPDSSGEITLTFDAPSNDAAVNAVQLLTPQSSIFTKQPQASTVTTVGSNVTISVVAPTATAFQWEKSTDGGATFSNVSGATSATLTFTNVQTSDGGLYRVVATTPDGSYTSSTSSLSVFTSNPNDPPVFVAFRTNQVASGSTPTSATTSTINAPGSGWPYSAAAQVVGTTWNRIQRPNPLIGSGTLNGIPGTFVCNSANNIALTSATGAASNVKLTMHVVVADLEVGSTTRVEPNAGAGGNTVLGPNGLMDNAWRIYRGGNSSTATFTGLTPNAHYLLYVYGSTTTAGRGCAFTLDSDNIGSDDVATKSTDGGNSGNIFGSDGSTYSLTAAGTTWQQFHAVANSSGNLVITTTKNSNNSQYYNGLQLVQYPLPVITAQPPASTQGTVNGSVSIAVSATNGAGASGTLSYQWQKSTNGGATFNNIDPNVNAGAVAATLPFSNLQNGDAGIYRVLVTNSVSGGTVISSNASLTVQSIYDSWLVAYLKFDEIGGGTAFDSSPNGNDGTLAGDPVWGPGKIDNALAFDGVDDHVTLPTGVVSGLDDFTVAAWVKIDSLDTWSRVFDFGSGIDSYMFLTTRSSTNGTMRFAMRTNSGSEQAVDGSVAMPTGAWSHVAVTLSGSTATLYLDGTEIGTNRSMSLTPASLGSTTQNYIGKSQWNDPLLDGAIDDFQIHDRALSANEVRSLVEMSHPIPLPAAPSGLAVVAGDGQVDLSWNAVDGADSYSVYRASGDGYVLLADGLTSPAYTDPTAANGTTYAYVVTASNAAGESAFSEALEATPFPEVDYSGRAFVAGVTALGSAATWSDTGELPPEGGSQEASLLSFSEPGLIAGEVAHAFTIGQADRTRSEASVGEILIDAGGVPIEAGFVMARALAVFQPDGTTGLAGGSEIGGLVVAGVPVTLTGEPNQVVGLPNGQLVINERIETATSITVNALRISLFDGSELIVSSARAGYESTGEPLIEGDDQLSGGGWIAVANGEKGTFGVSGGYEDSVLFGHLSYRDHDTGMKVKGTGVTAYLQGPTPNSRRIEGTAEIDGVGGFTYVVEAEDNGEPGDADTFSIDLSNGYHADGLLGGGNIQLHLPGE